MSHSMVRFIRSKPDVRRGLRFPGNKLDGRPSACREDMDSFKREIIELLESEFTCCICEEIMIKVIS